MAKRQQFHLGVVKGIFQEAKVPLMSNINVVVCGLTSSSFQGMSGPGAGKSVLCNRFIRPNQDDLRLEHSTVLNLSEFGSNVINNTHFLYWGEKSVVTDNGQTLRFQIVEHTEFVDDLSHKPFPYSKPYHKRVTQSKLSCSGKTAYIEPNQLMLPEMYANTKQFPSKFAVDGFIICVDISTDFDDLLDHQKNFFEILLKSVLESKHKPVIVAMTKYDRMNANSVSHVKEVVKRFRRAIPVIEVSALEGVNADLCFHMLAHLVDKRTPCPKLMTYSEAMSLLETKITHFKECVQAVLHTSPIQIDTSVNDVRKMLEGCVEFDMITGTCGTEHAEKIIHAYLRSVKEDCVKQKENEFIDNMPHIISVLLPRLDDDATLKNCKDALRSSEDFPKYFTDIKEWKNDIPFLKRKDHDYIPIELLDDAKVEDLLKKHIDQTLKKAKEEESILKIQEALKNCTALQPGIDMDQLWSDLGVANDATHVQTDRLIKIYHDCMGNVEQQCLAELEELLLEHHDIFDNNISDEMDMISRVSEEFKEFDIYKHLDKRPDLRISHILRHIADLRCTEKSVYGPSHLNGAINKIIADGKVDREKNKPLSYLPECGEYSLVPGQFGEEETEEHEASGGLEWILDPMDHIFNLSILARTTENAMMLKSDFMNYLSHDGTCLIGDVAYLIQMSLFNGKDIKTMTNENFVPQGAVAVVNTMECLDWLEKLLNRHWIPNSDSANPPYRGMPLVILALDGTEEPDINDDNDSQSPLHQGAKRLANIVQCVCIMEHSTPLPKRLVITAVIHQLILSLMNGVTHVDRFFNSQLRQNNPNGLNIAVCTLKDDPYPIERLLTPWLHHQLVSGHEGEPTALFLRSAIDRHHRTCTLTFHSALNVKDIMSFFRLGIILVYSTERRASLAVMKSLLSKLPALLPKMIVAMATNKSHDKTLLEEGRSLAEGFNATFVCNNNESLPMDFCSEFFCKCWFSRFNSYSVQKKSDSVVHQWHRTKQSQHLPDGLRPLSVLPEVFPQHSIPFHLSKLTLHCGSLDSLGLEVKNNNDTDGEYEIIQNVDRNSPCSLTMVHPNQHLPLCDRTLPPLPIPPMTLDQNDENSLRQTEDCYETLETQDSHVYTSLLPRLSEHSCSSTEMYTSLKPIDDSNDCRTSDDEDYPYATVEEQITDPMPGAAMAHSTVPPQTNLDSSSDSEAKEAEYETIS